MDSQAYGEIEALLGRRAGHIAYHPFDNESQLGEVLAEAAQVMWASLRSAWTLHEVWNNGATVWRSPDGTETVQVPPGGGSQV
jgi:hypothetical protein